MSFNICIHCRVISTTSLLAIHKIFALFSSRTSIILGFTFKSTTYFNCFVWYKAWKNYVANGCPIVPAPFVDKAVLFLMEFSLTPVNHVAYLRVHHCISLLSP